MGVPLALQVLGDTYLAILELKRAQQYLERAIALARETRSLLFIRQSAASLATAYILHGENKDLQRAEEVLGAAPGSHTTGQTLGQKLCGYAHVELALARGEAKEAWQLLDALQPEAAKLTAEAASPRLWKSRGETLTPLNSL